MSLSNYTAPHTAIDLGNGQSMAVRGLGLEDISFLVQVHEHDVDALVAAFSGRIKKDATPDDVAGMVREGGSAFLAELLQRFPALMANAIALAAGEPTAWENARTLPLPVQVEALLAIARHTFHDIDGFKKFVGNVSAVLRSVSAQATAAGLPTTKPSTGTTG